MDQTVITQNVHCRLEQKQTSKKEMEEKPNNSAIITIFLYTFLRDYLAQH